MKKRKSEKKPYTNLKLAMKIVFWGSTFIAAWLGAIAAVKANIPFGVGAILFGLIAVFADRYAGKLKEIEEGPRKLTASQMKRLSSLLSEVKLPINFNIEYEQNDLESGEYINELAKFLS